MTVELRFVEINVHLLKLSLIEALPYDGNSRRTSMKDDDDDDDESLLSFGFEEKIKK